MGELEYGQFDLLQDRFVIEDVAYDYAPDGWPKAGSDDAVRGTTVRTLSLTRKNTIQPARTGKNWYGYSNLQLTGDSTNPYVDARYVIQQTWTASWQNAFMSWCMRDHLMTLYTLQKGFWIEWDDHMSRSCATLLAVDSDRKQFVTPTYPIAFYRAGDIGGQYSTDHLYVELRIDNADVDWVANPYRIDPDIGLVVFENSIAEGAIVTLKYAWRAFVRIRELELNQLAMARHVYTGQVVFEQLQPPVQIVRFDDIRTNEPCRDCDDSNKRVGDTGEECADAVGPAAVREIDDSLNPWDNPTNVETFNDDYAESDFGTPVDEYTNYLVGYEFNLQASSDGVKKLSRFIGKIYHNATDPTLFDIDSVRLTYQGNLIGPNKADGTAISTHTVYDEDWFVYQFEIDGDSLVGFEFDADDFENGLFGIAVKYHHPAQTDVVRVAYMSLQACWEDTAEEEPPPADCGCDFDGPGDETIVNTSLSCSHREDTISVTGFDIPEENYVHGVEVVSLIEGSDRGCAEPPIEVAQVDVRLKLNTGPSSFSSWFTKSDQPVRICDHAYLNFLDLTSDLSWGGKNDCWGKPVGSWTPALINANGIQLQTKWDTTCNPQQSANWDYEREYDGSAIGTAEATVPCTPDFDDAWGADGENTSRGMCCDGEGAVVLSVTEEGTITHRFTWIGAGDPPPFINIQVYAKAEVHILTKEPGASFSASGSNGFGDPMILDDPGYWNYKSEGTHDVQLPVVDGVAELALVMRAYGEESTPVTSLNAPCVHAVVYTFASIPEDQCDMPELQNVDVIVHHSPVCQLGPRCFELCSTSGVNTPYKGEGCAEAISSDGSLNGAFSFLADNFGFAELGANSRIVGIVITGDYRVNPSYVRAGNLTFKAHIGSYDSGRTGKTLVYPQTNEWTEFEVGSNGDFWDYGSVFGETGVTYPTATGTMLNSLFQLEILGDNDSGYAYEFRSIKVKVFYFDVCDGF